MSYPTYAERCAQACAGCREGVPIAWGAHMKRGSSIFDAVACTAPARESYEAELLAEIARLQALVVPETCVCAAVIDPITKEVVRGNRHAWPMAMIWNRYDPTPKILSEHQGFITSRNRFVGRAEGLRLQKAAGIASACEGRGYLSDQLTSEDLYAGEY